MGSGTSYRRKEDRLEWHFMADCRKYPERDFVENGKGQIVMSTMVCPICKKLYAERTGSVDNRTRKDLSGGFFQLLFG